MAETKPSYILVNEENRERIVRVIKKLIFQRRARWLKNLFSSLHPTSLSYLWEFFTEHEQDIIISLLDPESGGELLSELDAEDRNEIFRSKDAEWIVDRLEELEPDDIVEILRGMSKREAGFIIRRFSKEYSEKIKDLLKYPPETAGAIMTSDFLAVNENARIESIIRQFRKIVEEDELQDIHFVYVVDRRNHYLGYIPIRQLILEKPARKASEIMKPPKVTVTPDMDQEEVAKIFRDFNFISVAVVSHQKTLLGRITIDDVVDVLNQEASEDVFRMVGLNKEESTSKTLLVRLRHRFPWMLLNTFTAALAASVIGLFTQVLEEYVVLAMFMPVIVAMGGATGNQMVALIVRGLATGDLSFPQVRWILARECTAVGIGALVLGSAVGAAAWHINGNPLVGVIVAGALTLTMIFATLVGAGIPWLLKLIKQDPALGSSILVSAITDMLGFFVFLGLATWALL